MPWDDDHARAQVLRVEDLLAGLDALPDGRAAARATETVRTLVALYGDCLARIIEAVRTQDGAADLLRRLADDELVGHLLLVHDLHPDPVETRVRRALAEASPATPATGGAELLELVGTTVRVRLAGGGRGCPSAAPPEQALREAINGHAPEIEHIEIETAAAPQPLIPVEALFDARTLSGRGAG